MTYSGGSMRVKRDGDGNVLSWCGCIMGFVGYGNYPYDCTDARRHPKAAVYEKGDCEHARGRVWTVDTREKRPW